MGWLKPFETGWFETRDGRRVFAVHVAVDPPSRIIAAESDGHIWMLEEDGSFVRGVKSDKDIVEHLQGCTGWNWKKPNQNVNVVDIRKCVHALSLYHIVGHSGQKALELLSEVADRIEKESE